MIVEFISGEEEEDDMYELVDEEDSESSGCRVELVDDAYLLDLEQAQQSVQTASRWVHT